MTLKLYDNTAEGVSLSMHDQQRLISGCLASSLDMRNNTNYLNSRTWLSLNVYLERQTSTPKAMILFLGILASLAFCVLFVFKQRKRNLIYTQQSKEHFKMHSRKKEFLLRSKNKYGYKSSPAGFIDSWRPHQLPGLLKPITSLTFKKEGNAPNSNDDKVEVYLDYAGSALPTASLLKRINSISSILANPHSTGPAAARTKILIEEAKKAILDHFHGNPGSLAVTGSPNRKTDTGDFHPGYDIIFTSGATESFRIVAERFPWSPKVRNGEHSRLVYPKNAHTSVVGMRGPVLAKGATFLCKSVDEIIDLIDEDGKEFSTYSTPSVDKDGNTPCCVSNGSGYIPNLAVLPLECNFGGDILNTTSISQAARLSTSNSQRRSSWSIMLDLAKAASSGPVNLRELDPDFATISFYKIFGEPTGLGALFVRRSAIPLLIGHTQNDDKADDRTIHQYFGGGSVDSVLPAMDFAVRRSEPSSLSSLVNGTIHFRGIASLIHGFEEIERIGGMSQIRMHTRSLASELTQRLKALQHWNENPVIIIYGAWGRKVDVHHLPGSTVSFNILREDGSFVGYNEFSKLASLNRPPLQLRTGCFCNPGACQDALGLSDEDVINNYTIAGHVCGDQIDIINDRPTGAIRASFGKDSIWEDLDSLVTFIERRFVTNKRRQHNKNVVEAKNVEMVLSEIYIFPIKSCAAHRVKQWKINLPTGKLKFDREFALVDSSGTAMRLQAYPKMCHIKPFVDLEKNTMTISAPSYQNLVVKLDRETSESSKCNFVNVCGNKCGAKVWGDYEASRWFSSFLGVQCWLARYEDGSYQMPKACDSFDTTTLNPNYQPRSFANEQPLLLISKHAVDALNVRLREENQSKVNSRHFRPNLVVESLNNDQKHWIPHVEDGWSYLDMIGKNYAFDAVGKCARCSMVDFDPTTGMKGKTLRALADYRRCKGQINFGIFLRGARDTTGDRLIEEGDVILCN